MVKNFKLKEQIPTENQEQRATVKWCRLQPVIKDYIVKINNEGKRTDAQGWHLKLMGMCVGASDLFLAYPAHGKHGLWLEMKRNTKYSKSQRETPSWVAQEKFQDDMKAVGFAAHFCYGCNDAIRVIRNYLNGSDDQKVAIPSD